MGRVCSSRVTQAAEGPVPTGPTSGAEAHVAATTATHPVEITLRRSMTSPPPTCCANDGNPRSARRPVKPCFQPGDAGVRSGTFYGLGHTIWAVASRARGIGVDTKMRGGSGSWPPQARPPAGESWGESSAVLDRTRLRTGLLVSRRHRSSVRDGSTEDCRQSALDLWSTASAWLLRRRGEHGKIVHESVFERT
jgi:hypothetical protein